MAKLVKCFIIFSVFGTLAFAQLPNSSKALLHTQTARNIQPGQLDIYTNMNFFTKVGDFVGNIKPQNFSSTNYWLVAGNAVVSYGIIEHLDASLGIRLYQDTHYENEYNLPDDIFLTIRAGSFDFADRYFQAGIMTSFRFPTGEVHNYPFAEYSSGAFEYGFLGAVSFFLDPYLPERAFSMHFNMGWWNYNEAGDVLYEFKRNYGTHLKGDKLKASQSSKDLRMALAAVFPTQMFDFRVELSGILYLTDPPNFVYSAEEWAFLSPSLRYKPFKGVSFDLGADFRLSPSERQRTSGIPDVSTKLDLPGNYPAWKVHMGANLSLNLLSKKLGTVSDYESQEAKQKIELFESVLDEKQKAESIQSEIENLRKIRKEAEKEIEDLKKSLEEEQ